MLLLPSFYQSGGNKRLQTKHNKQTPPKHLKGKQKITFLIDLILLLRINNLHLA